MAEILPMVTHFFNETTKKPLGLSPLHRFIASDGGHSISV